MSQRIKKRLEKANETTPSKGTLEQAPGTPSINLQDGIVREAVLNLIEKYENIIKKILDVVTQEIINRLINNSSFTDKIAKEIAQTGVLHALKQDIYKACNLDQQPLIDRLHTTEQCLTKLERETMALHDALDSQEQCSRRNCLLLHGLPEAHTDTTDTAPAIFHSKLNIELPRNAIEHSHRLGRVRDAASGDLKPRPVIIKFVSYEDRRTIFAANKKLKGTKIVLTENLSRRRAELLSMARDKANVKATWAADGRIICLLEDGRKVAIETEKDLRERCH